MLISDIHLRDYHKYNKFPNQRLYSFIELGKDIVKIGKDNNIDTLLIGGDIVDKNTLSPLELHVLFTMFTTLAKQFRIYSIIGNHDAKSKKSIDKEDTVITLLEKIPGISFHHQEILDFGGKKIAFENWMPEYDLSWIKNPVDVYMSHATIDYNNTGFFGMDTSVFDGKFKLGVFGDIHVTSQLGNLVSIGNTKQESRSDRYQGGAMILDLDDLSYERIPIDPEHKKYLHLVETPDEDEEGWVDKEGEDMTYKVFKPEKVTTKTFELKLPKITDIEVKTNQVMKESNLLKLHKEIKNSSDYSPVDFNFSLNYLQIKNFRSIDYYNLDLSNNYIITGHTGSGKSTLITALFYALIGNKKLKNEIKYGETSCQLKVSLDYQGINYIITRGTSKGDFGLTVDNVIKKYNSKGEFEKEVYEYLPFLNYHESFFFNYWDTELLGNLKVDRRYDLLAKYYRLDGLSDYNDIAEAKLKVSRKKLKTSKEELLSLETLKNSREEDLKNLKESLTNKESKSDLDFKLESHKNYLKVEKSIEESNSKKEKIELEKKNLENSIEDKVRLITSLESNLSSKLSLEDLKTCIENYTKGTELKERISKGESLLETIIKCIENLNSKKDIYKDQIKKNSSEKPTKEDLENKEKLSKLSEEFKNKISELNLSLNTEKVELNTEKRNISNNIDSLKKEIEDLENKENSICYSCGQTISNGEHIILLENKIKNLREKLNSVENSIKKFSNKEILVKKEIESLNSKRVKNFSELNSIDHKILTYNNSEKELKELNTKIEILDKEIKIENSKKYKYKELIDNLIKELKSFNLISEKEYLTYSSEIKFLQNIDSEKNLLKLRKESLIKFNSDNKEFLESIDSQINNLKTKLSYYIKLDSEEYTSVIRNLSLYDNLKKLEKDYKISFDNFIKKEDVVNLEERYFSQLETYCSLTSRSGIILKSILEELTKTFSSPNFKFTTAKVQANGKVITDMSVSYLVGKRWIPYSSLSSGQRTLCDLYYISKIITGVGIVSFDETLRFLDDENLKLSVDLIDSIKKSTLLISTHSSNLSMEGTMNLRCELKSGNTTDIELIV